jgi:hypothetical protein
MVQPRENEDALGDSKHGSWPAPTMLKALLREQHLQNYGMFKRAYQKTARRLDKSFVDTYPSEPTFRRWLAGRVKDVPHAEHCAVLEAMFPGWTAVDLFKPYVTPEEAEGSTLLQVLLHRRRMHDYRAFCRSYDVNAALIDKKLMGSYPNERQFQKWLSGEVVGLPHHHHCAVLETMFPGYSARRLFEVATQPGELDNDQSPNTSSKDLAGQEFAVTDVDLTQPNRTPEEGTTTTGRFRDDSIRLVRHLESLAESRRNAPMQQDQDFDQLIQFLTSWANAMNRRDLLRTLSWAAAAASMRHTTDLERVSSVLNNGNRVDGQVIDHIEAILWRCQRQDDALGPQAVLNTVLAQRDLVRGLLPECPATLRPRMLSVLSNASRHAGWLSFDLNDFESAGYYYEDARTLAHEAENTELGAFVLCNMSHLATWRSRPRIGIDHAVAASQWAKRTDDMRLRAYAADVAARAYAADKQPVACLEALDAAEAALQSSGDQKTGYIYFYDDGFHVSTRCICHLDLDEPLRAANYAKQALDQLDRSYTRNLAVATINLGTARAHSNEAEEAARLFGDAGELAARNSSARLIRLLKQGRGLMQPWENHRMVRELDERLTTHGLT